MYFILVLHTLLMYQLYCTCSETNKDSPKRTAFNLFLFTFQRGFPCHQDRICFAPFLCYFINYITSAQSLLIKKATFLVKIILYKPALIASLISPDPSFWPCPLAFYSSGSPVSPPNQQQPFLFLRPACRYNKLYQIKILNTI